MLETAFRPSNPQVLATVQAVRPAKTGRTAPYARRTAHAGQNPDAKEASGIAAAMLRRPLWTHGLCTLSAHVGQTQTPWNWNGCIPKSSNHGPPLWERIQSDSICHGTSTACRIAGWAGKPSLLLGGSKEHGRRRRRTTGCSASPEPRNRVTVLLPNRQVNSLPRLHEERTPAFPGRPFFASIWNLVLARHTHRNLVRPTSTPARRFGPWAAGRALQRRSPSTRVGVPGL